MFTRNSIYISYTGDMKTKLVTAALILSATVIYSPYANAQDTKLSVKSYRSVNFMAINTTPTGTIESYIVNDNEAYYADMNKAAAKMNSRASYMVSEQFVFDNLNTLKKEFSVADIYFDLDDAGIRADAIPVLDKLVNLMMENPEIYVATTSYSDSRMSKYNEKLALNRTLAANAYLVSKGIRAERLLIEKHGRPGMSNPCNNDPSCTLAVQQLNRRTEFNIVYNGINLSQTN